MKATSHAGYTVRELPNNKVGYDYIETSRYEVTTPIRKSNGEFNIIFVDLYFKPGFPPHGWEATKRDTTNDRGYYSTGGLSINSNILEDIDGVSFLPKSVCAVLRTLKYNVDDSYLVSPL